MIGMHGAVPVTATGEVFLDARGDGRALRVTWHDRAGIMVLSLWRGQVCAATFRLAADEVPALVDLLRRGLDSAYDGAHSSLLDAFGAGHDPHDPHDGRGVQAG